MIVQAGVAPTKQHKWPHLAKGPLVLAVLAVVLFAGGIATYAVVAHRSGGSKTKTAAESVAAHVRATEAPVSHAQQTFVTAVRAVTPNRTGLARLKQAAQAFSQAVSAGQSAATTLIASSSSDRADIAALRQLLTAQARLSAYFMAVPITVEGFTQSFVAPIAGEADAVNTAAKELDTRVPGAQTATIDPSTWSKLDQVVAEGARQAQMRAFLTKMETFLAQSATGRAQLASVLAQVQDNCAMSPDQAAQQFREVADNRQSMLDQASAIVVPQSEAARNVLSLFQDSMSHSIAADRAYGSWMAYLYQYYYTYPVGCPGTVPEDTNYQHAVTESEQATQAKTQFVSAFNRLARQYGLRADWQAGQI